MFYVTIIVMNVVKTHVKTDIFWRLAKKIPAKMLNACASHINLALCAICNNKCLHLGEMNPLGKYLTSS